MMLRAVIFDMDGVLINSEIIYQKWVYQFLNENHLEYPISKYQNKIGSAKSIFDDLSEFNSDISVLKLRESFLEFWKKKRLDYGTIFNYSLVEQFKWFKNNGLKLAIASSSPMSSINEMVKTCEIESFFDIKLSGRAFLESKPNPELFLCTASRLNVVPEECVVVEDSYNGILAGKRAGMTVIAVKDKYFSQDISSADEIIESIEYLQNKIKFYLN
jgi:beta-phosphoglucomutase-like phosphatase (HAD superfamily)